MYESATTSQAYPLFKVNLLIFPVIRIQIFDMAAVIGPFEASVLVRGIFIEQYIQVSICTLLVYDICEPITFLLTLILTTFIIVITYDKEVSIIINVLFALTFPL